LHVGAIVKDLAIQYGYLKGDMEMSVTWAQLGCALEHAIAHRYSLHEPDRYVQIGELEKDGIYGTPDLIDIIDGCIPEEIKAAWMSSNRKPGSQEFWRYEAQLMSYCYMIGSPIGRLRVCHVNGDWKGTGPTAPKYEYKFTRQELLENWARIKSHGERNRERLEEKAA
jgi:hypothetical protein